jgi:predicted nucleotidyltransferase
MFDIKAARLSLKKRREESNKKNFDRWKRASAETDAIIQMIIQDFNPTRIYQWGSVLDQSKFKEYSDIDIAVEGLQDVSHIFKIARKSEEISSFTVHLLELEKIEHQYAEIIKSKGKLIYEKH